MWNSRKRKWSIQLEKTKEGFYFKEQILESIRKAEEKTTGVEVIAAEILRNIAEGALCKWYSLILYHIKVNLRDYDCIYTKESLKCEYHLIFFLMFLKF